MVVHITSPVNVGVGTTSDWKYINQPYTNITTGLRVNYRGTLCLNDDNQNTGDYDDYIFRCHSAVQGSATGTTAVIVGINYENNGAFYGQPVSEKQGGDNGHVIGQYQIPGQSEGLNGDSDQQKGGIGENVRWKRLDNVTFMRSVSSLTLSKYTKVSSTATLSAGQFTITGNGGQAKFHWTDGGGTNISDIFDAISPYTKYLVKFTSTDTNSSYQSFGDANEKKWMLCEFRSDVILDTTAQTFRFDYRPLRCNFNLNSAGYSSTGESWGNVIIELIPPWYNSSGVPQSWPQSLNYYCSREADDVTGFMFVTQKIVNGTYTFYKKEFNWNNCTQGPNGNEGGDVTLDGYSWGPTESWDPYPNIPHYVWSYTQNNFAPRAKIINVAVAQNPDA